MELRFLTALLAIHADRFMERPVGGGEQHRRLRRTVLVAVPGPVGHDKKITGFPLEPLALHLAHAAAFDGIIQLVRGMAMLGSLLLAVEHLDPAGESRERG